MKKGMWHSFQRICPPYRGGGFENLFYLCGHLKMVCHESIFLYIPFRVAAKRLGGLRRSEGESSGDGGSCPSGRGGRSDGYSFGGNGFSA